MELRLRNHKGQVGPGGLSQLPKPLSGFGGRETSEEGASVSTRVEEEPERESSRRRRASVPVAGVLVSEEEENTSDSHSTGKDGGYYVVSRWGRVLHKKDCTCKPCKSRRSKKQQQRLEEAAAAAPPTPTPQGKERYGLRRDVRPRTPEAVETRGRGVGGGSRAIAHHRRNSSIESYGYSMDSDQSYVLVEKRGEKSDRHQQHQQNHPHPPHHHHNSEQESKRVLRSATRQLNHVKTQKQEQVPRVPPLPPAVCQSITSKRKRLGGLVGGNSGKRSSLRRIEERVNADMEVDTEPTSTNTTSSPSSLVLNAQQLLELGVFKNRIVEVRDDDGKILITGVIQDSGLIECHCSKCLGGHQGNRGKRKKHMKYIDFERHAFAGRTSGAALEVLTSSSRGQRIYLSNGQILKDFVYALNSGFVKHFTSEDLHKFTGATMLKHNNSQRGTLAKATVSFCQSHPLLAGKQFQTSNPRKLKSLGQRSAESKCGLALNNTSYDHTLADSLEYRNSLQCLFCTSNNARGRGKGRGSASGGHQKNHNNGQLLTCDACPQVFHSKCIKRDLGLKTSRNGQGEVSPKTENLLCPSCREGVEAFDPKCQGAKDLTRKCKQLLSELDQITGGCCLCHVPDFNRGSTCTSNTVILCDQCEREFHIGCLKKNKICHLKSIPKGAWFCSSNCKSVHHSLAKARQLGCYKVKAAGSLGAASSSKVRGVRKVNGQKSNKNNRIKCRYTCEVLCGEGKEARSRNSLNEALAILQESFDPLPHAVTGADLLPIMARAQTCADHDYTKVHTILLRSNGEPVCACVIRVCGQFLAEIPFVATKTNARHRGHCREMFSIIEGMLSDFGVEQYCLPAAAGQAMNTWIKHFGFRVMTDAEFRRTKADFRILSFPGTTVLVKKV